MTRWLHSLGALCLSLAFAAAASAQYPGDAFNPQTQTQVTWPVAAVEAAEALERSNENLERRVKERTEELTRLNAALAQANGHRSVCR